MYITVSARTRDQLNEIRRVGENDDELIQRLIEKWEATEIPEDQLGAAVRMLGWKGAKV